MPVIETKMSIAAPVERVFDLSRSIDLHQHSTAHTGETAIGGTMTGLLGLGEQVTWRAKHFGVWQNLTSRMTVLDRPRFFQDSQVTGAFKRFDHRHFFEPTDAGTEVRDVFDFDTPFGLFGRVANGIFLTRYMRRFLERRNQAIKEIAESENWRGYLIP